jgi:hypothetical protein
MKRLDEIINTGRLGSLIVLFLSLCMIDNASAAASSDTMRVTLLGTGTPFPNALPSKRSIASAEDAGRVFAIVKPKLGVVYHYKDEEGLGDAVRKEYNGPFVIAKDLIVVNVGKTVTWDEKSSADSTRDGDKSSR